MASVLDSRASGPGSSPGTGHCRCSVLGQDTVLLSAQVYKCVPSNLILGILCKGLASPPRGSRNNLSRFMLQKPG